MLKTAALDDGGLERAIVKGAIDEHATADHNILHVRDGKFDAAHVPLNY